MFKYILLLKLCRVTALFALRMNDSRNPILEEMN